MKEKLTNEEHDDRINQGLNECGRCGKWQNAEKEMYWQGEKDLETNEIISPYIAVCDDCYVILGSNKQMKECVRCKQIAFDADKEVCIKCGSSMTLWSEEE